MKRYISFALAVTLPLLGGLLSNPLKAEVYVDKADKSVTVNGLTGEVSNPINVARPQQLIEVKVCPADLINYEYSIEKTKEEKLQEGFSIVGVGPVFDIVSGGGDAALGKGSAAARLTAEANADSKLLLDEYWSLRKAIVERRTAVDDAVKIVGTAASGILFQGVKGCDSWPQVIQIVAGNGTNTPPFFAVYDAQSVEVRKLEDHRQDILTKIEDIRLTNLAQNLTEGGDFLDALKQDVDVLNGAISPLQTALDTARDHVVRWSTIMLRNPAPALSQIFLMPETSTRYTIGVKRKPITPLSRKEQTETDPAKVQLIQFASTTFENRALHRFNISLGMVAVGRQDNRDFEVVSSLDADNNPVYHVREAKRDEVEIEAATFLGIYFHPVDNYNPTRPAAWMVMLGTEISASPTDFFLGLGRDTRQGVIFGFGLTEYEGITPAKGWKVGQVIPTITTGADAGKPKIATVPKQKKDTIGAYLFLGFRPSIFKAFLDRRK